MVSGVSLLLLVLGVAVALLVGIWSFSLGSALGLLDHPDPAGGRKQHARVTPLVGGVAIVGTAVPAALLVAATQSGLGTNLAIECVALAAAGLAMWLIGALDDRWHLSPLLRLGLAVAVLGGVLIAAPGFVIADLRVAGVADRWLLGPAGVIFSLLCLVGLLNAVNMADGKNGIVIGMALVWTLALAGHADRAMLPLLAALGGALLVALGFNMAGRLFLGDGGSYALSVLFGLLAMHSYNHGGLAGGGAAMDAGDVATLFSIPVFDTMRLVAVRLSRRCSPFEGDRDHLHHHLHARLGWPRGLLVYLAMVGVPSGVAVWLPGSGFAALTLSFLAYIGVMAWLRAPVPQLAE